MSKFTMVVVRTTLQEATIELEADSGADAIKAYNENVQAHKEKFEHVKEFDEVVHITPY